MQSMLGCDDVPQRSFERRWVDTWGKEGNAGMFSEAGVWILTWSEELSHCFNQFKSSSSREPTIWVGQNATNIWSVKTPVNVCNSYGSTPAVQPDHDTHALFCARMLEAAWRVWFLLFLLACNASLWLYLEPKFITRSSDNLWTNFGLFFFK